MHLSQNHDIFDFVLTYNRRICDNKKYFYLPLYFDEPEFKLGYEKPKNDFKERKDVCLFASNKKTREWGITKRTLLRYLGFSKQISGFQWPIESRLNQFEGSLYEYRKNIAAQLPKYGIEFDIYGPRWSQSQFNGKYQPKVKGCSNVKSIMSQYKFVLATENCLNQTGYISEKIYDVLLNASVPIYLGSSEIIQEVPSNVMVNLHEKVSPAELSKIIKSITIDNWNDLRSNGYRYLLSEQFKEKKPAFLAKYFLELLLMLHQKKNSY